MANIGATTAFYKVETALTRANSEVSKSMERLATGKANANAGDRSSYVAMADTFRLDFVGTKAGIKGASVVMGYLETGMRVLDSASALLSRLQELAVLGANGTNTVADGEAINLEAEAIADEFNRLMTTSTYKGRDVYNDTAGALYVSMGGRDQEMTFGIGKITYTDLYDTERTIAAATATVDGPNKDGKFNLTHLPSDAVVVKEYGKATSTDLNNNPKIALDANKTYIVTTAAAGAQDNYAGVDGGGAPNESASKILAKADAYLKNDTNNTKITNGNMAVGDVIVVGAAAIAEADVDDDIRLIEVNATSNAFKAGEEYEIMGFGTQTKTVDNTQYNQTNDVAAIARAVTGINNGHVFKVGDKFTVDKDASIAELAFLNAMSGQITFRKTTDTLTKDIEAIQALVNTARVQAGSQYAAIESAVNYTTDLTAQYELGYNTVNDVNFSMETAHLAKNQILQQAATAMLAQANSGQQGLLQLIS